MAEFERLLTSGDTAVLDLGEPIGVRLLYHKAFVDEAGVLTYRPDVYGWDVRVAEALGLGPGRVAVRLKAPEPLGP